ncbi:MAG: porin [Gemmatimonadaceae bacterium]|nr:porin [Gemmatimonadaceae bacterium]
MRIRFSLVAVALSLTVAPVQHSAAQGAPTDSTPRITFGGFVDGYFAWDFGRPPSFDRSFAGGTTFTTQPARHNEFNINLAYIEAKLEAPHYRGRLALQTGTSVQSNYAGEPASGSVSGPALSRMIQEAVVGVQLASDLWVDGGVFYSHMGMEGWVSRDSPTYTRSLVAEYSPYYQSGVKLTWTPTAKLTAQLDLVNGWQNIAENNRGKGAGVRLDLAATSATTFSYYNFFSAEAGTRLRSFNGVGLKHTQGALTVIGQVDLGSQSRGSGVSGSSTWSGWTAIARVQATPRVALSGRVEGYIDADQVIIATGVHDVNGAPAPNPAFHGVGGSAGVDVSPYARVLWRTELRGWRNRRALFPDGATDMPSRSNALVVTSLALTF